MDVKKWAVESLKTSSEITVAFGYYISDKDIEYICQTTGCGALKMLSIHSDEYDIVFEKYRPSKQEVKYFSGLNIEQRQEYLKEHGGVIPLIGIATQGINSVYNNKAFDLENHEHI